LFFARPSPKLSSPLLFSIIGIGKGRQDVLPAHTTGLLSLPQKKIRAGKLLIDQGHQERLGGRPHYRYRRARRRRPVLDRALQKKHKLLMTMAKNDLKQWSL
jgi:hypothetical protein